MTTKLKKNLTFLVKKKVRIKDDSWSTPGPGYLNPGTLIKITGTPTYLSDVSFTVLKGNGEVTIRTPTKDITRNIGPGNSRLFLSQGHSTKAPYDWGTLDPEYFEVV